MNLRAEEITIAVTVYDRREFILDAVKSALNQTIPVKVIVVEDCGPDEGLQDYVRKEFGSRIQYFRNPKNRGLFDNWNACMEYCSTPWFSILHDDDQLYPNFIELMLALAEEAPGRMLYYGRLDRRISPSDIKPASPVPWRWRNLDSGKELVEMANDSILGFPGQLINIAAARSLGGFPKHSYFTGDWHMWVRLAVAYGAVETAAPVALGRSYLTSKRASSGIERRGLKWVLDNVQRKRNYAIIKSIKGMELPFDRAKTVREGPVPARGLFYFAAKFRRTILLYDWWLFLQSKPPHWRYALLQKLARCLGPKFFLIPSKLLQRFSI